MHQHNPEPRDLAEGGTPHPSAGGGNPDFKWKSHRKRPTVHLEEEFLLFWVMSLLQSAHSPSHWYHSSGQHRNAQHPSTLPRKNCPNSFLFYSRFFSHT